MMTMALQDDFGHWTSRYEHTQRMRKGMVLLMPATDDGLTMHMSF